MSGDLKQKLINLRTGNPSRRTVILGNGDDSVTICAVLLSSDTMLDINEKVDQRYGHNVEVDDDDVNVDTSIMSASKVTRMQYYNILLCYYSMRNPDNIDEYIFDSYEQTASVLNLEDIKRVCEAYNEIIINSAPKMELLTQEDYDELKKFLEVTPLRDLDTVSLIHLKYFHQTIHSED